MPTERTWDMMQDGRASFPDLLRLHLAVAGFGFAGVFGKLLALPPVTIVAGRAGFAALSLALLLIWRPASQRNLGAWRSGVLLGVLLAAHWWMFFEAVQVSTVAVALVSFSAFPVLVILWEALQRKRAPSLRDLLAAGIALVGVGVIAPKLSLSDSSMRGALWGFASGGAFAIMVVWNRARVLHGSPWVLAFFQNGAACVALLPFALLADRLPASPDQWAILGCLGIFFTAGTHGLFIRSLRSVPAKLASLVSTLEPVYGILAGILLLGERPSSRTLLGAGLVIGAVLLVVMEPRKR